jgi:D(-)-tartrate dehydratase
MDGAGPGSLVGSASSVRADGTRGTAEPEFRIAAIRHGVVSLRSEIENAVISFAEMDTSIVAVTSGPIGGRSYTGFGFSSNGRYAQDGILRTRLVPRLMAAPSRLICDETGTNIDPARAWQVAMANEKPGGHGERSAAMGALDMALWDLAAKIAGQPLHELLAERYGDGRPDDKVFVYAAGGYYRPGGGRAGLAALADEMRRYLDAGYTMVKMKIGGTPLAADLARIDSVLEVVGAGSRLAVDANGRLDLAGALAYGSALAPLQLRWYEEPGDPLDFALLSDVASAYPGAIATGENLFSAVDAGNLLRYGGLRPDLDILQVDPSLSYGVVEYARLVRSLGAAGWSARACIPHGGHQLTLHLAAALHLGGSEAYPGVFWPISGFGDDAEVVDGYVTPGDEPGIGIERNTDLYREFLALCEGLP